MKRYTSLFLILIVLLNCNDANTSKENPDDSKAVMTVDSDEQKSNTSEKKVIKKLSNTQEDWYWKNTLKSTNNKFENWNESEVTLVMVHKLKQGETTPKTTSVGSINSQGIITINLPKKTDTDTALDNLGYFVFYDIQDLGNIEYNNGKTGYFSTTSLNVMQNGNSIGKLTLGNSVRVTYNLTNQSTLTMGDEGYILSWTYVDEASSLKGTETRIARLYRDGTNTFKDQTEVVYNLNFKPGWNFVKTEVIGKYDLQHERGLNASWFKKHKHEVVLDIPNDAVYFFRKKSE